MLGFLRRQGREREVINLELYESTWVAMSVSVSLFIGFVAFVVMMNDNGESGKHKEEGGAK